MQKCVLPSRRECLICVAGWMVTAILNDHAARLGNGAASSAATSSSVNGLASVSANGAKLLKLGARTAVGNPTTG
jgi:hypothetical protein